MAAPARPTLRSAVSGSGTRATEVLALLIDRPDVGVSEVSRTLGWSKSAAHRALATLAATGFVTLDPETRRYRLGPTALRLGLAALARADLHRLALPHLRRLRDRTGETATVTVLSDDERVYVDQVESGHPVRQIIEVGTRAPLYLGASSKAMLAHLPVERREHVLAGAIGASKADGSKLDTDVLRRDLDIIRSRGFAISRGERVAGAASVAAPVFGHDAGVLGSISIAGVTARQSAADLEALGPLVRDAALALSHELGWHPAPEG